MAWYNNFEKKGDKYTRNRDDVRESAFESPVKRSDINAGIIDRNLSQFSEVCSLLRWMPDVFWDMYRPETGGFYFDLYQRVMIRIMVRFNEGYFCILRGGSKTLLHVMAQYHVACCFPNILLSITATTKESAVKIWKDKHDEILRFYPDFAYNIKSANFSKDTGRVEFITGSVVD